jgi:predicted ATP-grasp superfamily ATP-dependent carboligase
MTTNTDLPLDRFSRKRPPVVLLGGISLVRSLGLARIPVIVATSDRDEPALASRYCSARVLLPSMKDPQAVVGQLVALGERLSVQLGRRVPLMYGSDDALELIYAHRERLQRYFLFLLSERRVANSLIAKDRFQKLAESRGLPVPASLRWEGTDPGSLRVHAGPVLVKPRIKVDWHHTLLCQRLFGGDGKARIFESGGEAAAHPDVARFHDQLAFQQYIPGGDADLWSYHGFADGRGEVLAAFVGRKVRTFPTLTGESAFIEMARDESLSELGRDVARRCPLRGVFKMDFKRDPRDGRWYLLEINARYNLWHYMAARNGINLMAAAYDHLVDRKPPVAKEYATRYRWLSLELDFRAYREMARRGELTFAGWAGSILRSRNVYSLFSWRDPAPWLRFWSARVSRRLGRAYAGASLALRQWRSTAS